MKSLEQRHSDIILNAIKKPEDELGDFKDIIRSNIQGKEKEDIQTLLNTLINEPPNEEGGKNALTGFYFQLLCTLYYFAEVLEGKWDFLIFELHQDIIVGNDSTIRFIQVKSEVTQNKSLAKEVTKTKIYTDGWIQKLLSLAKLFPKGKGIKTEFELMTNFIITNSQTMNVEHYLYNDKFEQHLADDDDLLEKVTEYKTRGLDANFDFKDSCNESIKELLSRFCITTKSVNNNNIEDFIGTISSKLGKLIHKSAAVSFDDINYLLGEICSKCNHTNQGSSMYIDKEKAFEYLNILEQRVSSDYRDYYTQTNNNEIIDEVINKISENYNGLQPPFKNQVFEEFEQFRNYLKKGINEDFSITVLVHRYLEGKPYSLKHSEMPPLILKEKVEEIFKTLFILQVLLDEEITFSNKFKGILINEANNSYISLIGLDVDQTMEEGLIKLKNILEKNTNEEKLLILMQNNHTIFQGEYDDSDIIERLTLDVDEIIKVTNDQFDEDKSLKDVDYQWTIVPGKEFITFLRKVRRYENILLFKEDVQSKLGILRK